MARLVLEVWIASLRRIGPTWRSLLSVNLVYAALGILVLLPLTGVVGRFLIGLSGRPVLSDQDIASFFLTPVGAASLTLFAAILIAIQALAQASMMHIGRGAWLTGSPTLASLQFAAHRAVPILDFSVRLVARLIVITAPFLGASALAAWLLISGYDINYYLALRPSEFWLALLIVGALMLLMSILVARKLIGWSLALPLMLFAETAPGRAFAESERLTRPGRRLVLWVLILWTVVSLLLGAAVLWVFLRSANWIVPHFHDQPGLMILVLGGLVALWACLSFLLGIFNSATFAFSILGLGERLGVPPGQPDDVAVRATHGRLGPRMGWHALAAILVAAVVVAAGTGYWLLQGIQVDDQVRIVAHRGAAGKAPENTLASVRQAIEDGTDWVEIDVQETRDGEVVVVHDSDFMKLAGVDLKVWDASMDQLGAIDVGAWFGPAFRGERVPTLRQVLELARGKVGVVIELKYYGHDQQLEQRVVDRVEAAGMASEVVIMSLDYAAIQKIRALRPDWTIGLLSAKVIGDLTRLDADFFAVNQGMASASLVRRARALGKQVYVWTLNDPVSMWRMMSLGVAGVITDEPALARAVLEKRAELSPVERLLVQTALLFGQPIPMRVYRDESP